MNYTSYEKAFIVEAKKQNKSDEYIQKCLTYAKNLTDKRLPVIYDEQHALECTFGMGQCVFSDCISVRLKRMAERRHYVDITPIYFPLVWQERSSYRLMNGGSI